MFVLNHWKVSYELRLGERLIGGGIETISIGVGVEMTKGMALIVDAIGRHLGLDRKVKVIVTALNS